MKGNSQLTTDTQGAKDFKKVWHMCFKTKGLRILASLHLYQHELKFRRKSSSEVVVKILERGLYQ